MSPTNNNNMLLRMIERITLSQRRVRSDNYGSVVHDSAPVTKQTTVRHVDGNLAEHAHDQEHERARERVGDDDCGPCGGDGHAAADEESGADDAADGDHRDVARPQRPAERVPVSLSRCHCFVHLSPFRTSDSRAGVPVRRLFRGRPRSHHNIVLLLGLRGNGMPWQWSAITDRSWMYSDASPF